MLHIPAYHIIAATTGADVATFRSYEAARGFILLTGGAFRITYH